MHTLILMEGGHKTRLADVSVSDVEHALRDARTDEHEFVYFQTETHGDNGIAVDPRKVVAVVRDRRD